MVKKESLKISAEKRWQAEKPRFNGFAIGHGVHGDVNYNRRKDKEKLRREIEEER